MRCSAIIVAAGSGVRLGRDAPKAFVELAGEPLLRYVLRTIAALERVAEAVVTVPAAMERRSREEARRAGLDIPVKITAGGAERQDSVRIALALAGAESETVVVHDAARPFAPPGLFDACIDATRHTEGAIAAVPVADTLKRVDDKLIAATVSRQGLWQAQTPQAFRRAVLIAAHERAARERWAATDDADLIERCGGRVAIVPGVPINLKITTPADLELAEAIAGSGIAAQPAIRR